ncbi:hypothetical protein Tco_0826712 [Tanacetum coccineum]
MKNQGTSEVKGKNWNKMMERELGEGYSFIKKKCFVYGSLSHLIKDCDFYEKKMAREAELKKQRVFNTGNGVAKPVWNNANRVNHANHFVPRPVQLNAVRPNNNSVRPNVNTVRQNVNSVRSNVNTVRPKQPVPTSNSNSFSPVRPQVNKFNQRSNFSKSHSPVRRPIVRNTAKMPYSHAVKGNWGTAVKTSAGYNWRNTRPNSNCNSGSNFVRTDHPLKNMEDRGIFDSGCSGHMTGNKDHLDDFEECKGGSVTFGGSKGYITGKGRIRVGNLEFDSVSFVKELGHFNLFSISQICDKQHKVLFTETECLVVSPDFKMPDENQILLKVPRQHNMYSFDMKTPALTKDYACLIAKATSDESKLWHRRVLHKLQIQMLLRKKMRNRLIVVAFAVKNTMQKKLNKEVLLQIHRKRRYLSKKLNKGRSIGSTGTLEDNPKILAFRRDEPVNTGELDPDDSAMLELEIFHKSRDKGIFDEAMIYDEEGLVSCAKLRSKAAKTWSDQALISYLPKKQQRNNHKDQHHCLFAYFLSQEEPKKFFDALQDDSWVQAMQEELLQFKLQQVWVVVDLPHGMKVIGTKWVYRNKRDKRGVVPLVSLVQELVTPSKTVNASGEEQVEDISPTTLEAAAILTKVHKIKSVDKGKRYKRRKSSKEFAGTGLDFEEVKSAFEKVNTGGIKVSSGIEEINAGSLDVNTSIDPVTTDSIRVSIPSPDRGRREGKVHMTEEEETQASRKDK